MKYTFVIPCYSSAATINIVVDEIVSTLKNRNEEQFGYQIILINDHSKDETFSVIQQLCEENTSVVGIDLAKNFGQHSAIMAGLQFVEGERILFLDDDGQTDPTQMFTLFDKMDEGYDVVYGRYGEKKHSFFRKLGTVINDKMAKWLIHKPDDIYLSSYIAARRYVIEEIKNYHNPFPYLDGLILRTTSNLTSVDVKHRSRISGQSGYSFGKLLSLWINGFTEFSVIPLRISMVFGFIFALFGFGIGVYAIINKFLAPDVAMGWTSLIAAISFIGGLTLLMLGVIGEYIGRSYICMNNSPQYVIRKTINAKKKEGYYEQV